MIDSDIITAKIVHKKKFFQKKCLPMIRFEEAQMMPCPNGYQVRTEL